MNDIIIESIQAIISGWVFVIFFKLSRSSEISQLEGWKAVFTGFALIFFGSLIDISDNFPELNKFVMIGRTPLEAFLEKVVGKIWGFLLLAYGVWRWLPKVIEHNKSITSELERTKEEVNVLHGLLPTCCSCKKIRDETGQWKEIEDYISARSEAKFTHGICPDCLEQLYPEENALMSQRNNKITH